MIAGWNRNASARTEEKKREGHSEADRHVMIRSRGLLSRRATLLRGLNIPVAGRFLAVPGSCFEFLWPTSPLF